MSSKTIKKFKIFLVVSFILLFTLKNDNINIYGAPSNQTYKNSDVEVIGDNYGISANNVEISIDSAKELLVSHTRLLALMGVKGWNLSDKSDAPIEIIDGTELKAEVGVYNIVFAVKAEPNTRLSAKITVVEKVKYDIVANNLFLGSEDAKEIGAEQLIVLSKARAWQKNSAINSGTVALKNTTYKKGVSPGSYVAIFYVKEEPEKEVTINISVREADRAASGDSYAIEGSHFSIYVKDVESLNHQTIIQKAKVTTLTKPTGASSTIKVDNVSNIKDKPGVYVIKLYIDEEPTTLINLKVTVRAHIISGVVYEDTNYNSTFDESKPLANINVFLIDAANKNIVLDTKKTNNQGRYQFNFPIVNEPQNFSGKYAIRSDLKANYIYANKTVGSIINPLSSISSIYNLAEVEYQNQNIGMGRNLSVNISPIRNTVMKKDIVYSNINIENGFLDKISITNKDIISVKNNKSIIEIKGLNEGIAQVKVVIKNKYKRSEDALVRNIKISVY